ncbi:bifunctional (p)ppGpp synthetase/guanosine-3',5'-bis(diphosphate) 3'-pyrophosphohydrolase [Candidatus Peribacteria bacterium]|nr:bifunctional (p)ppGpp synthetase/guanosine-3',5'-bis(diphosphate) 3'-pyrophosphohydrolase [Candidatus Peribacteria bacterium]
MHSVLASTDLMLERLQKAFLTLDTERCTNALHFAQDLYGDRPYMLMRDRTLLEHAVDVAEELIEFCPDNDAVIACILQHTLKFPDHVLGHLAEEFGRNVRDMVSRIHLLSHLSTSDWRKSVDDMKIMLVSVSDDVRILLIALTIACDSIRHINDVKPEYRNRLCRQSLQLFAPVAARLGIYAIKYRLERDAFPECYPTDATHIGEQLLDLHKEHGDFLPKTMESLRRFLSDEGIETEMMAREKQPYSIFQKMHTKSITGLTKITDLFAIRVLVPEVGDCYQVLGLLHRIGTPISHRFKDYISFPKPNGYQSLHTSLIGLPDAPKNVIIEVQIRTREMHREAEYGVASHWLYKEDGKTGVVIRTAASQLHMSDVILRQQSVWSVVQAGEKAQSRLVNDIYVLTPRGDIIELPDSATPLDFAFMLHTDLGLRFKAARVNGHIVPLSHKLENGDVIEIQTHKYPRPSLQWTQELVTPSARAKLKTYFFSHNRSQFLEKGRENVNVELLTRGLPVLDNDYTAIGTFDGKSLSVRQREDLLVKVGMGSVKTSSILRHLPIRVPRKQNAATSKSAKSQSASKIKLLKDLVLFEDKNLKMPYRFAKCCAAESASPKPKEILGIVTRAGIVNIHKEGCRMTKAANRERKVKMRWA